METVVLGLWLVGESMYGLFSTCCLYSYVTVSVGNERVEAQAEWFSNGETRETVDRKKRQSEIYSLDN